MTFSHLLMEDEWCCLRGVDARQVFLAARAKIMVSGHREEQVQVRTLAKSVKRVGVGSIAVALLTLLCYRTHIDFASAIPLYLLLVVVQSLTGDFLSSAVIAVLSAGCLDFFLTQPLFSLRMANPLNGLALVAFVFTALVITSLVSRVREEAKSSKLQKDRLDRLYQLSQQLLAMEPDAVMSEMFLEPFHRLFGVTAVCIFDADTTELHAVGDSGAELAGKTREAYIRGDDLNDSGSYVSVRCLRVRGRMTGAIGFAGLRDPGETVGSLTALTAALVERKNAFRKASAAAAAAETAVYRSALLDALAHEFKTPLATILAAAGGIREAGPLAPEQREMADTVESEAARLGSLTSRLLRTARLDSEEIRPRRELIDLTSLIAHIATQYSARSPDRRIVVTNRREEIDVLADPELLRLTLNQLIENACKYSQPGSTVTIEIERQKDFIAVKVLNSGSSIPINERSRIFERFYRGAEAKRSTSGTGLGLYIARRIALAHGGALDLETEERANDGVTFCMKIPSTKDELNHVVTAK
jgi:two-component system, OmpR family, sensor histidine kinase KdpD